MPALLSSQVVQQPGRYLRVFVRVGMGCVWGLPSRRSGLKAGGMVWYGEYVRIYIMCARHARDYSCTHRASHSRTFIRLYVRIYNMCARHARDVLKAGGSVLVLRTSLYLCIAIIVQ